MSWPLDAAELVARQQELAASAPPAWEPPAGPLRIGGCFVCFPKGYTGTGAAGDPCCAAAVVLYEGRVVASCVREGATAAAYTAGLLALREGPVLEAAVRGLSVRPDILLVNATGRDHPRGAGSALHLGAALDLPTVGVTHRPLLASGEWPADVPGATSPLYLNGWLVGAWLRTRAGTRPLAVDAGWRTAPEQVASLVLRAIARHRTPEPLRQARRLARLARPD